MDEDGRSISHKMEEQLAGRQEGRKHEQDVQGRVDA